MDWIWKSVLLVLVGMILLRIAGRKSISQMSVVTTVIMISIGTTIVQPIANHELGKAIGSATVEPNGQLGYVLKRHARPVTIGDLEEILRSYAITRNSPATGEHSQQDNSNNSSTHSDNSSDIFQEVSKGAHAHPVDPKLQ
ncbi:DUF421 domain-containing protein [Paenibacillus xylanexedens]|uniref:DUF421 domain-containing protein n=1 Tax=Paenibacillus xylanexedens TaxID=528191 RepID=UPI001F168A0D|nr:DUF421 domain-containing protein [Paenibacillus xylanexedens]MCF7752841.1 DUF421 domain-containing protein [Paenibacillus xylanexedens]